MIMYDKKVNATLPIILVAGIIPESLDKTAGHFSCMS